jgi:hypothetical protein
MIARRGAGLLLIALVVACGGDGAGPAEPPAMPQAGAPAMPEPPDDPRCRAPEGPPPRTIADVVALINALPKPVTIPCVIDALPHPLEVNAAHSILSAQPAVGKRSPRIFFFLGELILSVVPEGMGAQLLEFGERRSETHTLKAELEFPIDHALLPTAPYESLRFDERNTTCGFCHAEEEVVPELGDSHARISRGIRPMPSQRVTATELRNQLAGCDAELEPERCAMLKSIFGRDRTALDRDFPLAFKTFF